MPLPAETYASLVSQGTSPALTWYADDSRIELSGKVLANHITKNAHYLADSLGIQPGDGLTIALPPSWKGVTWTFAAMLAGARVNFLGTIDSRNDAGDVRDDQCAQIDDGSFGSLSSCVVTNHPELFPTTETVIAVATEDFAFAWPGELPFYAEDGTADAMAQPDTLHVVGRDSNARINSQLCEVWLAAQPNATSDDTSTAATENGTTNATATMARICTAVDSLPAAIATTLAYFPKRASIVVVTGSAVHRIDDIARSENAVIVS